MSDRLRLAVENGHVVLPEGNILVLDARRDSDLTFLDPLKTRVHSHSFVESSALSKAGWQEAWPLPDYAGAIVFLQRARDAQRASIRFARAQTNGPIIIDGSKTDGVEALFRELKGRADLSDPWSKAHGKVFTVSGGRFDDWPLPEPFLAGDGWWRAPGVFSADGIDPASAFLAETLPGTLSGSVVDLGAGWGYLSHSLMRQAGVQEIHLVEDHMLALHAALRNCEVPEGDAREHLVRPHHADALTWKPDAPVDHVVTNPPFHVGRAADPSLGQGFIRAAAGMLKPKGQLWLVANRHLPYETTLKDAFRTVELHAETPSFKIFHATSPNRRKG